jgi:hypothetical protein
MLVEDKRNISQHVLLFDVLIEEKIPKTIYEELNEFSE